MPTTRMYGVFIVESPRPRPDGATTEYTPVTVTRVPALNASVLEPLRAVIYE